MGQSKWDHLFGNPGLAEKVVTEEELQEFLLDSQGRVFLQGSFWDIKNENIGPGIYRVYLKEHKHEYEK